MNSLLFIRHAETDMSGTFCGHSDPPVNERGYRQIEALLKTLENQSIDAVYCSDLQRAITTAHEIAKAFHLTPVAVSALREIYFGDWEGLTWQEIERRDAAYARRWSELHPRLPAPGGESFVAFEARVKNEVHHLLALTGEGCRAVITHGGVMRVVLQALCGIDEKDAWEQTRAYCSFFRYTAGVCQ